MQAQSAILSSPRSTLMLGIVKGRGFDAPIDNTFVVCKGARIAYTLDRPTVAELKAELRNLPAGFQLCAELDTLAKVVQIADGDDTLNGVGDGIATVITAAPGGEWVILH